VELRPVHPIFGAEISGIDLRAMSSAERDAIARAQAHYAVLVFPGQRLKDDELARYASHFGPLQGLDLGGLGADQHVFSLSNMDADGKLLPRNDRRLRVNDANQLWHADSTYLKVRATLSLLTAHIVPRAGGETEYCDTRVAYEALPAHRQRMLEKFIAVHSLYYSRIQTGFTDFTDEQRRLLPKAVRRPLVETHAGSGRKALMLAAHIESIEGIPVDEGRAFVRELIELATRPEFVYTHAWREGDLVIWDNRCTMHRGLPFDEVNDRRDMHSCRVLDAPAVAH
jgi:alpha-ketoglutarate-dependent 2,4-dichlorophenoxyacetate dioxygenase